MDFPETNEDGISTSLTPMEVDYYTNLEKAILDAYERQLIPLKEDVCIWLSDILKITVEPNRFMSELSNGLVLCRLAEFISTTAYEYISRNKTDEAVPRLTHSVWKQAKKGTFFARENVANFIEFCRRVGVHDVLIFETEDLVQEVKDRPIVVCLLELARVAHKNWKVEPPTLVKLEFELDNESVKSAEDSGVGESSSNSSLLGKSPKTSNNSRAHQSTPPRSSSGGQRKTSVFCTPKSSKSTQNTPLRDINSRKPVTPRLPSSQMKKQKIRKDSTTPRNNTPKPNNNLTHKATQIAVQSGRVCACSSSQCSRNHLKKISEGKYEIYGKTFNIRLLNNNHVMVRVGGGWDTLEHYLLTHEPVAVTNSGNTPRSDSTIRGRYISPQAPRPVSRKLRIPED